MQKFITVIYEWIKKNVVFILFGLTIFLMFTCFVSGCNYYKKRFVCPDPSIITNTVLIHDTIIHEITANHYIQNTDTIIYTDTVFREVDTAMILKDYFAIHVYNRHWEDTLIKVDLKDTVTQNTFLGNKFKYEILRPQTIINTTVDNSVHYNKYLYVGLDIPFKNSENASIDVLFAFQKGYLGAGYLPLVKGFSLKTGVKIAKFK